MTNSLIYQPTISNPSFKPIATFPFCKLFIKQNLHLLVSPLSCYHRNRNRNRNRILTPTFCHIQNQCHQNKIISTESLLAPCSLLGFILKTSPPHIFYFIKSHKMACFCHKNVIHGIYPTQKHSNFLLEIRPSTHCVRSCQVLW
jgi:hypothetical protein